MGQGTVFLSQKATGHPYHTAGGRTWRGSSHPCLAARCCFLKCEVRSGVTKVVFCNLSEHISKAVEVEEEVGKARKPRCLGIGRGEDVLVLGTRHAPGLAMDLAWQMSPGNF